MGKKKILIVEDSESLVLQLTKILTAQGDFEVVSALTFAEAKGVINAQADELFLAILDLSLPDSLNGEAVEYALSAGVPSIVFTGRLDESIRKRLLSLNIIDYIIKDRQAVENLTYLVDRFAANESVKVLVVDDSMSIRGYVKRLLEKYNLEVLCAEDGFQALGMLQANPEIMLVISDFEMPGMNGVELTSRIRRTYDKDELAIIGLSSMEGLPLSVQFIKNGANDFLKKPFEKEEFYCRVIQNIENVEKVKRLKELSTLKDHFLGVAAHDLRSPLSGVRSFVDLMLSEDIGPVSKTQQDILRVMKMTTAQMDELVSDLLDISSIESGKLKLEITDVEISELVNERVRIAECVAARKKIAVINNCKVQRVVACDRRRVAQSLDNYLANALKYSAVGSTVCVFGDEDKDSVKFCVQDEGPGISASDVGKLFTPFKKLDLQPTGGEMSTGLGLAIVSKIAEAHGGSVWVDSRVGEGSAFWFSLPID
ncbi:MAG: response regulator [Desulfovibrio sp.]